VACPGRQGPPGTGETAMAKKKAGKASAKKKAAKKGKKKKR
jgi:hypothetical protein